MESKIDQSTRKTAQILGLAGLIPFFAGAFFAWFWGANRGVALEGLVVYAALIVTFIGALHWGRILSGTQGLEHNSMWLIWSIIPSLFAWIIVFLPPEMGILCSIGLLFLCLLVDIFAHKSGRIPSWMMRLRYILTSGASASLLIAWVSGLEIGQDMSYLKYSHHLVGVF